MKFRHFTTQGLLVLTLTIWLAGAAGLLLLKVSGERLLAVQTASMVPAFHPGDALLIKPVPPAIIKPGDIISYHSPRDRRTIITHRLTNIDSQTGWLTTAGDALPSSDQPIPPHLVIGRATTLAPSLGSVLDFLHRPLGLGLAVYLPALIVIVFEFQRLVHAHARPRYFLKSYKR